MKKTNKKLVIKHRAMFSLSLLKKKEGASFHYHHHNNCGLVIKKKMFHYNAMSYFYCFILIDS